MVSRRKGRVLCRKREMGTCRWLIDSLILMCGGDCARPGNFPCFSSIQGGIGRNGSDRGLFHFHLMSWHWICISPAHGKGLFPTHPRTGPRWREPIFHVHFSDPFWIDPHSDLQCYIDILPSHACTHLGITPHRNRHWQSSKPPSHFSIRFSSCLDTKTHLGKYRCLIHSAENWKTLPGNFLCWRNLSPNFCWRKVP